VGSAGDLTQADQQLLDQLTGRGLHASARQLKRWREAGVLAPPVQRSAGRGRGRPSLRYPPEAADQAAVIVELLALRVPLDEMAMAMFLRGAPVTKTAVRRALLAMLPDEDHWTEDGDEDDAGWADDPDLIVVHLLRRARRIVSLQHWSARARGYSERARGYSERAGLVLSDMVTGLVHLVAVRTYPSPEAEGAAAHILGTTPSETTEVLAAVEQLSPDVLRQTASTVTC
jgi:hypothetical protein